MSTYILCIYGYNNEHDFFYMAVKDTQRECRQLCHRFQKSLFWSVYTEMQPQSFQTKTGSAVFSKVSVLKSPCLKLTVIKKDRRWDIAYRMPHWVRQTHKI